MKYYFSAKTVEFENCIIVNGTRNFSGSERTDRRTGRVMNSSGRRNFLIELSPEAYKDFLDKNWNVGQFKPREDEDEPNGFLRVTVSYFKAPPIIHLISGDKVTMLDEEHIYMLDNVNIENLDMRCAAVNKQNREGEWKKYAYVEEMWVTITPDRFAEKYAYLNRSEND